VSRPFADTTYNGLRTAWKRVVAALGGVDATAACVRVGRSQVSDYGVIGNEKFVPIDVVLDAESIAGQPLVTAALAAAQGYMLTPVVPRSAGDVGAALIACGREHARLFVTAAEALADGEITATECVALIADLGRCSLATGEAMHLLTAKLGQIGDASQ
jgi:hypothetical protein